MTDYVGLTIASINRAVSVRAVDEEEIARTYEKLELYADAERHRNRAQAYRDLVADLKMEPSVGDGEL